MFYFKEEYKNHNKEEDCPMCSIDEEIIKKLKEETEKEKQKNKGEENK